jgi:hypothetical protein
LGTKSSLGVIFAGLKSVMITDTVKIRHVMCFSSVALHAKQKRKDTVRTNA